MRTLHGNGESINWPPQAPGSLPRIQKSSPVTAWATLVQPVSSGRVALRLSEYRDAPLIHTNYYGTEADRAAMLWTYKKLRGILNQDRFGS
ncbi:hypothetical protein F4819DRAFT_444266 [Hypoxylon fuscum]|nr:hypothetical protein F4819DRAFT_444266 [Hypoxylon fuscum]